MRHSFMGVDPGIVHTGVVTFEFWPDVRKWCINHAVIDGLDEHEVEKIRNIWNIQRVFIEAYNPRSHFDTDARMVEAISRFRKEIKHAKVIKNTGAKQVVKTPFMQMLDVWTFNTVTHHQDLRAAARIGLYGALKDEELNSVLTQFLTDTLAGAPSGSDSSSRRKTMKDETQELLDEKGKDWGDPVITHTRIAQVWSGILDHEVQPHQVALCMASMKLVRSDINPDNPDSLKDGAAYIRIAEQIIGDGRGSQPTQMDRVVGGDNWISHASLFVDKVESDE